MHFHFIVAQHGPFHATQLWNEMVEVLRQEVSMKRRRVGRHRGQEESFSGADAVDVVLKFLRERRDQFSVGHDSGRRDKAVKVVLVVSSLRSCSPLFKDNIYTVSVYCDTGIVEPE